MSGSTPAVRDAPPRLNQIQAPVRGEVEGVVEEIRRIILSDFQMVEEVNEYLLLMRGKLFRPTLLLLSSQVEGTPSSDVLTLGAVVELVHLATLVHDDAVDHSVLRRGLPTVNLLWNHQVAIIMGDYLYSRSVMELARLGHLEAIRALARASNEMSLGEMRQLTSHDSLDFSEQDYHRLIAAKTASLMSAACEIGALSGARSHADVLARFGHNLGMAFQIADDLLDYQGSEAVTGKPSGHDLRERKVTLPLLAALRNVTPAAREEVREFFTLADPSDEEIGTIIGIVNEAGGMEYSHRQAQRFAEKAEALLEGVPAGDAREALRDAVAYAVHRQR
ncbi:MAG: polyprenyl synthetase family protein [Gemmatimonadota bacterium]